MKTYVFDTNSLIRYFLGDVEDQYSEIAKILKEVEKGKTLAKLSILVIAEVVWVFGSVYKMDRSIFVPQLLDLILLKNLKIIECDKSLAMRVLGRFKETKFDFVDVYLSLISTKEELFSFDKDFKKLFR